MLILFFFLIFHFSFFFLSYFSFSLDSCKSLSVQDKSASKTSSRIGFQIGFPSKPNDISAPTKGSEDKRPAPPAPLEIGLNEAALGNLCSSAAGPQAKILESCGGAAANDELLELADP